MSPPEFKFVRPLFHPNIYPDGKLCISILHAPGEDETSGELASVLKLMPLAWRKLISAANGLLGALVTCSTHIYRVDLNLIAT